METTTQAITDEALAPSDFLAECIAFKKAHAPSGQFMIKLVTGRLNEAQLQAWAKEMYYYVEPAIPTIAAWLTRAPIIPGREIFKLIGRNIAGELGYIKEPEHYDLFVRFCEGLGLSRDALLRHLPLPSTIGAAAVLGFYCRNTFEEGLGAFGLAVEMNPPGQPNGAEILGNALRAHYGLDGPAMEFWDAHMEVEDEHGDNATQALMLFGQTREQQALIRRAFQHSVIAHQGLSEGYDRLLGNGATR